MLRRLSDVTLGSFDKIILKISSKNENYKKETLKERKRKFKSGEEAEDNEESVDEKTKEQEPNISLRKSKGHWDLKRGEDYDRFSDSGSIEDLVIDLSSDISDFDLNDNRHSEISLPSSSSSSSSSSFDLENDTDLSVDENEWTQYFSNAHDLFKMKSFEFVLWKEEDYHLIPLDINEIFYWNDFYQSLKSREEEELKRNNFYDSSIDLFANHPDLTEIMRTRLINWIFEITLQFSLHRETIYSTQTLIDYYLIQSNSNLPRGRFQLLGPAALLISSKLEEIKPPNLFELVQICDETFTEQEIANFEVEICGSLRWHLAPINLLTWSNFYFKTLELMRLRLGKETEPEPETESSLSLNLSLRFSELKERVESVMDLIIHSSAWMKFKPSKLSAAIFLVCYQEQEKEKNQMFLNNNNFKLITGINSLELELEINWIRPYLKSPAKIVCYEAEKFGESLNNSTFDLLFKNNKIALNFLKNQIKREEIEKNKENNIKYNKETENENENTNINNINKYYNNKIV